MKILKTPYSIPAILFAVILILVLAGKFVFGWTAPTQNPPLGTPALYYDSANSRIGISNSSPTEKLDITGNLKFSGSLTGGSVPWARITGFTGPTSVTGSSGVTASPTTGAVGVSLTYPSKSCAVGSAIRSFDLSGSTSATCETIGAGGITGSGTSDYVTKWSGASALTNSIIRDNGTYVGVGTSPGTYKLNVNGTINGTQLCIAGTCQSSWPAGGGGGWTDGGTSVYLTTTGDNVGIGTTAPGTKLDILESRLNTSAMRFYDGTTQMIFVPNLGAGGFNNLSQSGDIGIFFNNGAIDTGNLVIGPHSSAASGAGLRMNSYGNIGIGMQPVSNVKLYITSTDQFGLIVTNNGTINNGAIYATNYSTSATITGYNSGNGIGVYGRGLGTAGVYGEGNTGVYGQGNTYGIYCLTTSGLCGGNKAWTNTSDERLKTNIKTIDNALSKVLQLRGVEYAWKEDPTNKTHLGFIAQEVLPILPEVISKDAKDYYSMTQSEITAVLVEAVKEQQKQIETLKTDINTLKNK